MPTSVDLPAPLGPRSAVASPARSVRSTPASARWRPYTFVSPRASTVSKVIVATRSSQLVELAIDAHQARGQLLLLALALVAALGLLERGQFAEEVLALLLELVARRSAGRPAQPFSSEAEHQRQRDRGGQIAPRRVVVRQPVQVQLDAAA